MKMPNKIVSHVFVLSLALFLAGCNLDAYFSQEYTLPHSQSPEQLAAYLGSQQLDYQLDGWFFFGSLIDKDLPETSENAGVFAIQVQRIRTPKQDGLGFEHLVSAAVIFNSPVYGEYLYGGMAMPLQDMAPNVIVTPDPWRVEVYDFTIQEQPLVVMSLTSGLMGAPGAIYRLEADVPDNMDGRLQADVLVCDRLGAVNQGYGTTSFFPQYLTAKQAEIIAESYGNSVGAYLEATGDPMKGQGSYYHSLPLIDVTDFSITRNNASLSSGTKGVLWADYCVQSYNGEALQVLIAGSSWEFFSIMLPEEDTSIMAIRITSATGVVQVAKLFNTDGSRTRNNALNAAYTWDSVEIEKVPGSTWPSPNCDNEYYLEYRLKLGPENPSEFEIKMVRPNQEIQFSDGRYLYEGLGTLQGTLGGKPVTGTVFTELESVGDI